MDALLENFVLFKYIMHNLTSLNCIPSIHFMISLGGLGSNIFINTLRGRVFITAPGFTDFPPSQII